jgi:hypothetical protein
MSSSRREFLKRGTLVALAAGVPLALTEKAFGTTKSTAFGLNMALFKSQLGTSFQINHQASKVKITLVDVANFASRKQAAAGKEGFSPSWSFRLGPKARVVHTTRQSSIAFIHNFLISNRWIALQQQMNSVLLAR